MFQRMGHNIVVNMPTLPRGKIPPFGYLALAKRDFSWDDTVNFSKLPKTHMGR